MRASSHTDFQVEVTGIGKFTFGRRTLGDAVRIRAEYRRLNGDNESDAELQSVCHCIATVKVLCVSAPAGYEDIEDLDLIDNPEGFSQLFAIHDALKEKEDSFRKGTKEPG
jgi:hypothetical protein